MHRSLMSIDSDLLGHNKIIGMLPLCVMSKKQHPDDTLMFRLGRQQQKLYSLIKLFTSPQKHDPLKSPRNIKSSLIAKKRARSEDMKVHKLNLEIPGVQDKSQTSRLPPINITKIKGKKEKQAAVSPKGNKIKFLTKHSRQQSAQKEEFLKRANLQREALWIRQVYKKRDSPFLDPVGQLSKKQSFQIMKQGGFKHNPEQVQMTQGWQTNSKEDKQGTIATHEHQNHSSIETNQQQPFHTFYTKKQS